MKFFNRAWEDSYDELITFYPKFYLDVYELEAILRAQANFTNGMMDDIELTYLDGFIDNATEAQIARWENFLHISLNRSLTLDDRRRAVKAYIIGFGKISASVIKAMVNAYLGIEHTEVAFEPRDEEGNNAVLISIFEDNDITANFEPLRVLLRRKIPAHLWYWFIQIVHYYMDWRELMDFQAAHIRHETELDFWETRRHNGRFYHNGAINHRIWRRYDLKLGFLYPIGQLYTPELLDAPRAIFEAKWNTPENISTDKIREHIPMRFWFDYDPEAESLIQLHDGRFKHDGEIAHGKGRRRRYDLRLHLSDIGGRLPTNEEMRLPFMRMLSKLRTAQDIRAATAHKLGMDFWGLHFHDGVFYHNGRIIHGRERGGIIVSAGFGTKVNTGTEEIGEVSVLTRTHEVHHHDGRMRRNGVAKHKSIYKKEVID